MSLAAGTRLGSYEILAQIGAGGMGEVYRARDIKLGRDVAIKVLPEAFACDADRMARFEREAKVLASLNHPNIAAIYGLEESNGIRALVMELVEGPTVAERIGGRGMPVDEALPIAKQIADALEAAHEKGIVHRDLKPANVKITPVGVVKILDFGLAVVAQPPGGNADDPSISPTFTISPTRAGMILGTAPYMAPEQARGKAVDKRADIWAFGVVLYEMLAGKRLFRGEDITEILASVVKEKPDLSGVPAKVRPLLESCLEKDPKKRLRDIGDAWRLLDEPAATTSAPSRSRFTRVVIAALAVIAVGVGWIAWRATRPLERPLMQLSAELGPDTSLALLSGGSVALSPNGNLLALTVRGADGQVRLGTRRIDESKVNILAGTEGAQGPFFSADGHWIAYSNSGGLNKISAQGGAPLSLSDTFSLGGSWGDDGTIITVPGIGTGLSRIREGGAPVPFTELNPGFLHRWPQLLPGSQAVLFSAYDARGDPDDSDIDVISLKTRERKTLYHGGFFARYLPSGHLVFIHRNTLFAAPFDLKRLALTGMPQPVVESIYNGFDQGGDFDFSQTGTLVYLNGSAKLRQSIFWLDSASHIQPLQPTPGICTFPRFSPDGKHLAYSLDDGHGHTDIWVRDLDRDTPRQLTLLPGRNSWPVWTVDSKAIIFEAADPAVAGIYWMRSDGSGAPRILTKERWRPQAVSPDGKWLLVIQMEGLGRANILQAPIEGDPAHPTLGKAAPFLTSTLSVLQTFSRDGRWVASITADPANRGIWVRPFPGPGGQWKIDSAGLQPVWSRAGNELFYMSVSDGRMMAVNYTANDNTFTWYKPRVWSERRLLDLGPYPTYDAAPDGKRFAAVLYEDGTAQEKLITHVTFLLNFFDELRRRVPVTK